MALSREVDGSVRGKLWVGRSDEHSGAEGEVRETYIERVRLGILLEEIVGEEEVALLDKRTEDARRVLREEEHRPDVLEIRQKLLAPRRPLGVLSADVSVDPSHEVADEEGCSVEGFAGRVLQSD